MQYGVLPGGGSPKRQKKSPARVVAGHLYNQVRRPSRFRGRLLFTVFGILGILCMIYGRKHAVSSCSSCYMFSAKSLVRSISPVLHLPSKTIFPTVSQMSLHNMEISKSRGGMMKSIRIILHKGLSKSQNFTY